MHFLKLVQKDPFPHHNNGYLKLVLVTSKYLIVTIVDLHKCKKSQISVLSASCEPYYSQRWHNQNAWPDKMGLEIAVPKGYRKLRSVSKATCCDA